MEVIRGLFDRRLGGAGPVVLTMGFFDGVHLGHRKVLDRVVSTAKGVGARSALLTFDPHPRRVIQREKAPRLLTSLDHKLSLLAGVGLDYCVILKFDRIIAGKSAEAFVEDILLASMDLKAFCVGARFAFGRNREGDASLLTELGNRHGFRVEVVEPMVIDGVRVSATVVREMVEGGDLERAARFLGRPYSIIGVVVKGKALGGRVGVPTANLKVFGEVLPPMGVYAVRVHVRVRDKLLGGVLNIDFNNCVEVHLFDFNEDVYGEKIEVMFHKFIRGEARFASLEKLVNRIRTDIEIAREILHNGGVQT